MDTGLMLMAHYGIRTGPIGRAGTATGGMAMIVDGMLMTAG